MIKACKEQTTRIRFWVLHLWGILSKLAVYWVRHLHTRTPLFTGVRFLWNQHSTWHHKTQILLVWQCCVSLWRSRNKALWILPYPSLQKSGILVLRYKASPNYVLPIQLSVDNLMQPNWPEICQAVRIISDLTHPAPSPACKDYRHATPCRAFSTNFLKRIAISPLKTPYTPKPLPKI